MKTSTLIAIALKLPKFADWSRDQVVKLITDAMATRNRHMKAFGTGGEAKTFSTDSRREFKADTIKLSKQEAKIKEAKLILAPLFAIATAQAAIEATAFKAPKVSATKRTATKAAKQAS